MALANGTYAECTVAKADVLAPIPDALSFELAGALPLVTTTGAQLIERAVKPKAGQTVLVTGAPGGVGRTTVHVAHKNGARVLAGVRAKEKGEASKLNVDGVVARRNLWRFGMAEDLEHLLPDCRADALLSPQERIELVKFDRWVMPEQMPCSLVSIPFSATLCTTACLACCCTVCPVWAKPRFCGAT